MSHWWVYSPEWNQVHAVTEDGLGPTEETCDFACVEATNGGEAIAKALPMLVRWLADGADDIGCWGEQSVTFKVACAECRHGACFCDDVECPARAESCEGCDAEAKNDNSGCEDA